MSPAPDNETTPKWVSNRDLQLELKALRSEVEKRLGDVKLMILGAVALNQFLASIDLPSSVTVGAVVILAGKGLVGLLLRGGTG